jgi:4-amino-4-deoxy-L-arabinose transferase-like glycosyltransferase
MAFEIAAPVFGVALALTLMLYVDRARKLRARQMPWTFIWVSICIIGTLLLGGFAAFLAGLAFGDTDGRILDGGVVVALLAVAGCVAYSSRHRRVHQGGLADVPGMAFERRRREQSHPLPAQIDSLAVVTGRYESARELAAHDAQARKELVDYLGRQIARREFGDPEAQVIDGYILAVFESRPGFGNQG